MASTKPTLMFIHGCFSTPAAFDRLAPLLEQAGYSTLRATYPSTNPEKPQEVTASKDVEHVREKYLLPLIEKEGQDLVLVMHSWGGAVGGGAAVGLSKTDRLAHNLAGGVVGFINVVGMIAHEGQTLVGAAGGQWPPWMVMDSPRPGVAIIDPLIETHYQDVLDESLQSELRGAQAPQGFLCLDTPVPPQCWAEKGYEGRIAYIRTAYDNISPLALQDHWLASTGVPWDVTIMETSHAPYISQPKELAGIIVGFIEKYVAL